MSTAPMTSILRHQSDYQIDTNIKFTSLLHHYTFIHVQKNIIKKNFNTESFEILLSYYYFKINVFIHV